MSQVLFIQPNIEKLDTLIASIQEDVVVKTSLTVDKSELQSYSRVGFLYHQDVVFPFVLEGGDPNDNDGPGVGYFSQTWLDHFAQSHQIVDLLTCEYQEDLAYMLKDVSVVATINYSTDTTGNTPVGDWILEKSINGNENVDVKAEYFTEGIQDWDVYLYKDSDSFNYEQVKFLIDQNNNILSYGKIRTNNNAFPAAYTTTGRVDASLNNTLAYTDASFSDYALIQKIFTGSSNLLAIDIKGDVWSWGSDKYDYLGFQKRFPYKSSGLAARDPDYLLHNIIKASASGGFKTPEGWSFTNIFLRADGKLIGGSQSPGYQSHYTQIMDISHIIQNQDEKIIDMDYAIGLNKLIHVFLTNANKIYVCSSVTVPFTIKSQQMTSPIKQVFAHDNIDNTFSLDVNGVLYDGNFSPISTPFSVQKVSLAYNDSYLLLDISGNIYEGTLIGNTLGTYTQITLPVGELGSHILANMYSKMFITKTGRVFSWGEAYYNGFDVSYSQPTEHIIPGGAKIKNLMNDPVPLWNGLAVADICFLGDTVINTDQGKLKIKDVKAGKHTINNNKIKHVTQTRLSRQNTLMLFKKNALAPGVPDRNTYVTKDHKIMYNNKMVSAQYFELWNPNVKQVKYKMHTLYNIALEGKGTMIANNMQTETLDPSNKLYKIYDRIAHLSDTEKVKFFENYNHEVRKHNKLA
jgi:hypothetical protein